MSLLPVGLFTYISKSALESVPEIRMFISQLHPRSQPAIFIFVVFFQHFLTSPDARLRFILPRQIRDIHQGTKNHADGAGLIYGEYDSIEFMIGARARDLQYEEQNHRFPVLWPFLLGEAPCAKDPTLSGNN